MGTGPKLKNKETGKHRKKNDEGLYVHFRDTCSVYDAAKVRKYGDLFATRKTAMKPYQLYPSRYGWVLVCYETKGFMTFSVQLTPKRAAWQRIEWAPGFDKNWDERKVRKAITWFINVAEHELNRASLHTALQRVGH